MALCAAALSGSATAQERKTVTVRGVPVTVEIESVKCGVKAAPGVSVKRLANCDSSTLVTLPGAGGITFTRFDKLACTRGPWERFIHRTGPIGYADAIGYYFKIGLYTTHPFDKKMVAFHRDYRRGATAVSVQATEKIFRLK